MTNFHRHIPFNSTEIKVFQFKLTLAAGGYMFFHRQNSIGGFLLLRQYGEMLVSQRDMTA